MNLDKRYDIFLDKCKHYVLQFYDETIEIIAHNFAFEQLKNKPAPPPPPPPPPPYLTK